MTLIIVSNRLPFSVDQTGQIKQSSGGLVSAISGINQDITKKWVGIAPDKVTPKRWEKLEIENKKMYRPVFVDLKLYKKYYNGISNDVLWPIFHYELSMNFDWSDWEAYEKVNQLIAEKVNEVSEPDDIIWVHDFHLFLVPQFLRKSGNINKIGFFLHIPFPSSELFRQIPVRKEILEGVLESDLIGFHDYSYLKYFCSSAKILLGVTSDMLNIKYNNRNIELGVFPVSIDTEKFINASKSDEVKLIFDEIQSGKTYEHLILGVDRLDYIKGFLIKLEAFRKLLILYPEFVGKVSLLQIAVPSREDVPKYNELKRNIERLISEIKGEFSQPNYTPIQYIHSSVSFEKMVALYKASDILFVSSRRDGMNLVSFEYIASQSPENPGVVVLSEFTGAASVLSHAVLINPWDAKRTADKLANALKMPVEEKIQRNKPMLDYLKSYTASEWAGSFMEDLSNPQYTDYSHRIIELNGNWLPMDFTMKEKLLLFIDYDGTLVPIEETPEKAVLTVDAINNISKLINNKNIEIVIVSGRDSDFLEKQFDAFNNLEIAAEHGAKFFDKNRKEWKNLVVTHNETWFPFAEKIMKDYSKRVPESFVEAKEFSVVWHYRLSPEEFSEYQAKKLKEELETGLVNLPLTIVLGTKVVEARAIQANKGYFVNWYLNKHDIQDNVLILAIGDDTTDEDMFFYIQNKGISVKVGLGNSIAKYILKSQSEVAKFLNLLSYFKGENNL